MLTNVGLRHRYSVAESCVQNKHNRRLYFGAVLRFPIAASKVSCYHEWAATLSDSSGGVSMKVASNSTNDSCRLVSSTFPSSLSAEPSSFSITLSEFEYGFDKRTLAALRES
jgi:hypothetical protein